MMYMLLHIERSMPMPWYEDQDDYANHSNAVVRQLRTPGEAAGRGNSKLLVSDYFSYLLFLPILMTRRLSEWGDRY